MLDSNPQGPRGSWRMILFTTECIRNHALAYRLSRMKANEYRKDKGLSEGPKYVLVVAREGTERGLACVD